MMKFSAGSKGSSEQRRHKAEGGVHTLELPCEQVSLSTGSDWLRTTGRREGLTEDDIFRMDFCMTEVAQNIISYANPEGSACVFTLMFEALDQRAILEISDDGPPFDPLQIKPPPKANSVEEMPIGGLGIHLVRQFCDDLAYERRDGKNILTLYFEYNSRR